MKTLRFGSSNKLPRPQAASRLLACALLAVGIAWLPAPGTAAATQHLEQGATAKVGARAEEGALPARDEDPPAETVAPVGQGWG